MMVFFLSSLLQLTVQNQHKFEITTIPTLRTTRDYQQEKESNSFQFKNEVMLEINASLPQWLTQTQKRPQVCCLEAKF